VRGAGDAAAKDDDLRCEIGQQGTKREAKMTAEIGKDLGGNGIASGRSGNLGDLAEIAGTLLIVALNGSSGKGILEDAAFIRRIPNLAAGCDSGALSDDAAIDGKGRADASSERDADGSLNPVSRTSADLAEQESSSIMEEANLGGLPAEALGQGLAEVHAIEKRQFMLHAADAGGEFKGSGEGKLSARNAFIAGGGLKAEPVQEADKGLAALFGRVVSAGDGTEAVVAGKAKRGRDMAASYIVNEDRVLQIGGQN